MTAHGERAGAPHRRGTALPPSSPRAAPGRLRTSAGDAEASPVPSDPQPSAGPGARPGRSPLRRAARALHGRLRPLSAGTRPRGALPTRARSVRCPRRPPPGARAARPPASDLRRRRGAPLRCPGPTRAPQATVRRGRGPGLGVRSAPPARGRAGPGRGRARGGRGRGRPPPRRTVGPLAALPTFSPAPTRRPASFFPHNHRWEAAQERSHLTAGRPA